MKLDILIFAVHPDDAELGCSGTILKHKAASKKVGVIDLTRGELGSRGSAEIRDEEAKAAAEILGLDVRENLAMRDGFFQNDEAHILQVIRKIRQYQPEIVIGNAFTDRHPDHGRASKLINDAVFLSGLVKIQTEMNGLPQAQWRPGLLLHFIQDTYIKPDILIDVTPFWETKMESVRAYKTQFYSPDYDEENQTYISNPEFIKAVEARARDYGKSIGVTFAEGFTSSKLLGVDSLFNLI